jgi:hypothetical protein
MECHDVSNKDINEFFHKAHFGSDREKIPLYFSSHHLLYYNTAFRNGRKVSFLILRALSRMKEHLLKDENHCLQGEYSDFADYSCSLS